MAMCGISGWSAPAQAHRMPAQIAAMQAALGHRGPDDRGTFFDAAAGISLAHNRLSIIDLSAAGHQPMVDEESGDVLVFNGEIYNYRELRRELQAQGHEFRSQSDSEVLLHALRRWGMGCLPRLRGMFAFALWSPRQQALFLARDPMGIKPLYYWLPSAGDSLVFASEVKAFRALADFPAELDAQSLRQFLEFGYVLGEKTIFQHVFRVLPGTWLRIEGGRIVQRETYFSPGAPVASGTVSEAEWVERTHATLDEVVAEHLVADVPVGILLSGGLDSGLVAALSARHARVQTFTMGFADSDVDERPYGRQVSEFIGSEHAEIEISAAEIQAGLEDNVRHFDDLFADWGMISTRLLYLKCRERGIKVVVVGEGADELFGGYGVFRHGLPGALRGPLHLSLFRLYREYTGRRYGRCFPTFSRVMKQYLREAGGNWFHAIRLFESRQQLPANYVMKVDKASMSVSVEARVPYLDSRVAELAYATPREWLLDGSGGKRLLKQVARTYGLLPASIIERPKFGAPLAVSWMDDSPDLRAYAREVILDAGGWIDRLGLRPAMTDYFERGKAGYPFPYAVSIFRNLAWRLLLLNLWSRHYTGAPAPA